MNRLVFDFHISGVEHSLLLTKAKISVLDESPYYGCALFDAFMRRKKIE